MKKILYIVLCLFLVNLFAACGLLFQNHRDFTFYQAKENITELSRMYITWDRDLRQSTIEVKETISGEKLTTALQSLCELSCTNPPFEPNDTPIGECFMIKNADGCYQILDKDGNSSYNKEKERQLVEYLSFNEDEFHSLWIQGFGANDN